VRLFSFCGTIFSSGSVHDASNQPTGTGNKRTCYLRQDQTRSDQLLCSSWRRQSPLRQSLGFYLNPQLGRPATGTDVLGTALPTATTVCLVSCCVYMHESCVYMHNIWSWPCTLCIGSMNNCAWYENVVYSHEKFFAWPYTIVYSHEKCVMHRKLCISCVL
jgi:hypothetical protein